MNILVTCKAARIKSSALILHIYANFQGSTGVKFSDVAGIDEAVEELQEVGCSGIQILL